MEGKCRLYGTETTLRKSHIIPKFAFDYLKATGGRFFRNYANPNRRVQDGITKYMLSEKAEQEFSKRERWFANNIFFPYMKEGSKRLEYDENFAYFIISVLWRVLIHELEQPSIKDERLSFMHEVAEEWRSFLADSRFPRNYNDLNVLLTDRVLQRSTNGLDVDQYTTRMIDATIIFNQDYSTVGVYAKFLRFMFWSIIKGPPSDGEGLKVKFTPSTLLLPQSCRDEFFGSFIYNRICEIDNLPYPNEAQQEKILDEILKNEQDFWESDAGKSWMNDRYLRG